MVEYGNFHLTHIGTYTADTTITDEGIVGVDTSGGVVTVTIASSVINSGATLIIQDEGGNAGTDAITIATGGSENINGSATLQITSNYGGFVVESDGSNLFAH